MPNRNSIQRYILLLASVFFALIFSLIPTEPCSAEEITLTTYYPSPYGVYSELRLYPKADATTPCDPLNPATQSGVMYYDNTFGDEGLKVCGGSPPAWQPVGGGGYWTLSSNNLYATNTTSWNVGIGTSSPGTKLSVRVDGNGANAVLRLSSILSSWTAGFGPRLLFHGGSDDRVFGEIGSFLQNTGTGANAYMAFSTRNAETIAERVRITSTGNVGIGTTGPGRRLEINGGGNIHGAAIRFSGQPASTDSAIIELMNPAGTDGAWSIGSKGANNELFKIYSNTGAADRFSLNVNDGTTLLNPSGGNTQIGFISAPPAPARLSVLGNVAIGNVSYVTTAPPADSLIVSGNIGIGKTNPAFKLDVESSTGAAGSVPLRLKSIAPETGTLLFQIGAQADTENTIVSLDRWEAASKNFTIAGWNLGNIAMIKLLGNTVYVPGSVGIGTTAPGLDKLDVRGRSYSSGGWQTVNADYAEWVEKESYEDLQPGDIIGINLETGLARKYRPGDRFIGIHSTNPAVIGNRSEESDIEMAKSHVLVGLVGQLDFKRDQVKIEGNIVRTIDGKEIGVLLKSGKVLLGV